MSSTANIKQFFYGQRPNDFLKTLAFNDGSGVRLFHIRAKLCKNLVEGDSDGNGYSKFKFYTFSEFIRNFLTRTEQHSTSRNVKPAFVKTVRLDFIGIFGINLTHKLGMLHIQIIVRRNKNNIGTLLIRHPHGIAGFYVMRFCFIVFSENDAVTRLRIAENCNRFAPVFGMIKAFHRGVKII